MRLFLLRHGETEQNVSRTLQMPDTPLSKRGLRQANLVARHLISEGVASILSSDYLRATETANIIAGVIGAPVSHEPLLRERDFGNWRGTAYADLEGSLFNPAVIPPGGESVGEFERRIGDAFTAVELFVRSIGAPVVIVTHGLVCKMLVNRHLDPLGKKHPDSWDNTSVTEAVGPPWKLLRTNYTAHLNFEVN